MGLEGLDVTGHYLEFLQKLLLFLGKKLNLGLELGDHLCWLGAELRFLELELLNDFLLFLGNYLDFFLQNIDLGN